MFVKKCGVALAAGLVAVACATPVALAADAVKDAETAVKSAQLDVDYFCTTESDYYDMAKCADAEAAIADAKTKLEAAKAAAAAPADVTSPVGDRTKADLADAKLDAQYFCAEGTEYYDMVKCADAQARLGAGSGVTPDAPAGTPDAPGTTPGNPGTTPR